MITDAVRNITHYRGIHKNLDTAIDFLKNVDWSLIPDGKTEIDGTQVFVHVMEADLREAEGATFEYHRTYADLQLDITGSECWEYTLDGDRIEEFNVNTDFGQVCGAASGKGILREGEFVLFLPGEFHKPSCISSDCVHVRKAVIKIAMTE